MINLNHDDKKGNQLPTRNSENSPIEISHEKSRNRQTDLTDTLKHLSKTLSYMSYNFKFHTLDPIPYVP